MKVEQFIRNYRMCANGHRQNWGENVENYIKVLLP